MRMIQIQELSSIYTYETDKKTFSSGRHLRKSTLPLAMRRPSRRKARLLRCELRRLSLSARLRADRRNPASRSRRRRQSTRANSQADNIPNWTP